MNTRSSAQVFRRSRPNVETYPIASIIYYNFPERGGRPAVRMTWYDGGLMPPAPAGLPPGQQLPDNGVLYVGSKGVLYHSSHGGMPRLLPAALQEEAKKVPRSMARSPGHYEEWVAAYKGGRGRPRISTPPARSRRSCCWACSRCARRDGGSSGTPRT